MRRVVTTAASDESDPGGLAADPDALLERLQEPGWERM